MSDDDSDYEGKNEPRDINDESEEDQEDDQEEEESFEERNSQLKTVLRTMKQQQEAKLKEATREQTTELKVQAAKALSEFESRTKKLTQELDSALRVFDSERAQSKHWPSLETSVQSIVVFVRELEFSIENRPLIVESIDKLNSLAKELMEAFALLRQHHYPSWLMRAKTLARRLARTVIHKVGLSSKGASPSKTVDDRNLALEGTSEIAHQFVRIWKDLRKRLLELQEHQLSQTIAYVMILF
jgi:hypothetical protein